MQHQSHTPSPLKCPSEHFAGGVAHVLSYQSMLASALSLKGDGEFTNRAGSKDRRPFLSRQNPIAHGARQPSARMHGHSSDAGTTGCITRQATGPSTNVHSRTHFKALRSSAAARSCSAASCAIRRRNHQRSDRSARVFSFDISFLSAGLLEPLRREAQTEISHRLGGSVAAAQPNL